jgi:hypothetical protein
MSHCGRCLEEFRYDDCGGYNPPCECGAQCRSCCDEAVCERNDDEPIHLDDCCDLCGEAWERCRCDGEAITVNKSTQSSGRAAPSEESK